MTPSANDPTAAPPLDAAELERLRAAYESTSIALDGPKFERAIADPLILMALRRIVQHRLWKIAQ